MNFFKTLFSKPLSIDLQITSSNGFHLRPVAQFVAIAKTYPCTITVTFKGKSVSAKAINALLSLGLEKEDSFTLTTQGTQAQIALEKLHETFETLMQKDKEVQEIYYRKHSYNSDYIKGDSIYAGIAIAPLYSYTTKEYYQENHRTFQEALSLALSHLEAEAKVHTQHADIFVAQKALLEQLSSNIQTLEDFNTEIYQSIHKLKGTILENKRSDYLDLLTLVKSYLGYYYESSLPHEDFILLVPDLLPSQIKTLTKSPVRAVILTQSALTSHTAILLRSASIPSLLLTNVSIHPDSHPVILDSTAGVLIQNPSDEDKTKALSLQKEIKKQHREHHNLRFSSADTKSRKHIHIYANITDVDSAVEAKESGAEGIGLLRTEFLFTQTQPTIQEQEKAYSAIFDIFSEVTIRTLDVGGDKALPYLTLEKESNPFLGVRGIRLLHTHPTLIEEQLLAIFRASKQRPVKIMFPMISTVEEFTHAKTFAHHIAKEHALNIEHILFGIMIEVPAVLFALKDFDKVVDFYSVGTNDLTQYLFAIERTHPTLKTDSLSPIVFRALAQITAQTQKPLSICGELASDSHAIEKLITLGFHTLSMTATQIPSSKAFIRTLD